MCTAATHTLNGSKKVTIRTINGDAHLSSSSLNDAQVISHTGAYAARLIRFKTRQLSRYPGFTPSDRADIEQELRADLLKRLPKYDPAKAQFNTFVSRIIERKIISIVRHRFAEMRSPVREEFSLNDDVRDADGRIVDRHQTTPEATTTWQRLHDLERDIADLRKRLPSELHRMIMDILGRGGTINAAANELGIPRSAVQRHIRELHHIFEDAGLREYL